MEKTRCQSCGMPLGTPGFYGTNADSTESLEYCKFCYQDGAFVLPDVTVTQMVQRSVDFMTSNLGYSETTARKLSEETIPQLKRWHVAA